VALLNLRRGQCTPGRRKVAGSRLQKKAFSVRGFYLLLEEDTKRKIADSRIAAKIAESESRFISSRVDFISGDE
jgi:hypothetical protein